MKNQEVELTQPVSKEIRGSGRWSESGSGHVGSRQVARSPKSRFRGKYRAAGIACSRHFDLGLDADGIHPRRGRGKSKRGGYPAKADYGKVHSLL